MQFVKKNVIDLTATNNFISTGLGTSVVELFELLEKKKRGIATDLEVKKIDLIIDAMNETVLSFGMDCNMDGIPDSIQELDLDTMAKTSCCRLGASASSSREKDLNEPRAPRTSRSR